jgi:hypothetical protein
LSNRLRPARRLQPGVRDLERRTWKPQIRDRAEGFMAVDHCPTIGNSTASNDRIRIDYNTDGLAPGAYTGLLTVAVRDRRNCPGNHGRTAGARAGRGGEPAAAPAAGGGELVAWYPFDGSAEDAGPTRQPRHGVRPLNLVSHGTFGQAGFSTGAGKSTSRSRTPPRWSLTNSLPSSSGSARASATGGSSRNFGPAGAPTGGNGKFRCAMTADRVLKYACRIPARTSSSSARWTSLGAWGLESCRFTPIPRRII